MDAPGDERDHRYHRAHAVTRSAGLIQCVAEEITATRRVRSQVVPASQDGDDDQGPTADQTAGLSFR